MSNTTTRIQSDADKLKQAGSQAGSAVQDAAHAAGQKAQELAHTAGEKVRDATHSAGHKAEEATASLGGTLKTAADTVRAHTPNEGMFGRASNAVAGALEHGGQYLQDRNLSGMADDLTGMIRRNPIPAVLLGVGLGFLIGRTLRS
jgi:hypothetical protein